MGARGPAPMPTALRVATGNRSRKPLPINEPQSKRLTELPPAPSSLSGVGLEMWHKAGAWAIRDKTLADVDLPALEALCQAWHRRHDLELDVAERGHTQWIIKYDDEGNEIGSREIGRPQVVMLKDATIEYKKWCESFGWTPSSRTRVQTLPGDDLKAGAGGPDDKARAVLRKLGQKRAESGSGEGDGSRSGVN